MKKMFAQSGLILLLIFSVCVMASCTQKGKFSVDKDGKEYTYSENDCKFATFTKLNEELIPKGFIAGSDGGFVVMDNFYYCIPCVKYAGNNKPKELKKIMILYKPIEPIVHKHVRGAVYEYCKIEGLK